MMLLNISRAKNVMSTMDRSLYARMSPKPSTPWKYRRTR